MAGISAPNSGFTQALPIQILPQTISISILGALYLEQRVTFPPWDLIHAPPPPWAVLERKHQMLAAAAPTAY